MCCKYGSSYESLKDERQYSCKQGFYMLSHIDLVDENIIFTEEEMDNNKLPFLDCAVCTSTVYLHPLVIPDLNWAPTGRENISKHKAKPREHRHIQEA